MTTDARRSHLKLLAKQDLARLAAEGRLPRLTKSAATWAVDIAFWVVFGGIMALTAYVAFCVPR